MIQAEIIEIKEDFDATLSNEAIKRKMSLPGKRKRAPKI